MRSYASAEFKPGIEVAKPLDCRGACLAVASAKAGAERDIDLAERPSDSRQPDSSASP